MSWWLAYTNITSPGEERYYWKETQIRKNGKPSEGFCVILPLWIKKSTVPTRQILNTEQYVLVAGSAADHCPMCETFLPGQWGTGSQHPLVNVTWNPGRQQQWLFWWVWQHTGERKEVIGKQQWETKQENKSTMSAQLNRHCQSALHWPRLTGVTKSTLHELSLQLLSSLTHLLPSFTQKHPSWKCYSALLSMSGISIKYNQNKQQFCLGPHPGYTKPRSHAAHHSK